MTKGKSRFGYIAEAGEENKITEQPAPTATSTLEKLIPVIDADALRSVPRREGRTDQKTQLNVRVPKELKRHALARAAIEGRTVGELIETLLIEYLEKVGNSTEKQ